MDTEELHSETEGELPKLHPLIEQFVEPTRAYFLKMDNFYDQWDDAASDRFKDEVVEHCRKTTRDFLKATITLTDGYAQVLEQAKELLNWKAGMGRFLSIIDIEMLVDRQMSRLLFGRDDQRW